MRHSAGVSAHNLGQNQFLMRDTLGFSFANKYCNEAGDQYVGNEVQPSVFISRFMRKLKPQRMNGY